MSERWQWLGPVSNGLVPDIPSDTPAHIISGHAANTDLNEELRDQKHGEAEWAEDTESLSVSQHSLVCLLQPSADREAGHSTIRPQSSRLPGLGGR